MVEVGESGPGVADIGVRHRRVLSHDVEALDVAFVSFVGDLDDGETAIGVEFRIPELFELRLRLGIINGLIVGVDDGDETRVGGSLNVVLAAQRMESRARAADLSRHHRECDQATRIVGPMNVLGDPHAPENHHRPGIADDFGNRANGGGINAADRRHGFWRERLEMFLEVVESFRKACDVILVVESLLHDYIHDPVEQRNV